jgi:hypothetical protein
VSLQPSAWAQAAKEIEQLISIYASPRDVIDRARALAAEL